MNLENRTKYVLRYSCNYIVFYSLVPTIFLAVVFPFMETDVSIWAVILVTFSLFFCIFALISIPRSIWLLRRVKSFSQFENEKFGKLPDYNRTELWNAMLKYEESLKYKKSP